MCILYVLVKNVEVFYNLSYMSYMYAYFGISYNLSS